MQGEDDLGVPVEEIMQKIKDEAVKRKFIGISSKLYKSADNNKINFPKQRIDLLINEVRFKSRIRTNMPGALNRFPVNKCVILQKIILKFYNLLFREQRNINNKTIDIIQELYAVQAKATEESNILQAKFSELNERVCELSAAQSKTTE
jgi:O-antigen chain-terminating methyltransferase